MIIEENTIDRDNTIILKFKEKNVFIISNLYIFQNIV